MFWFHFAATPNVNPNPEERMTTIEAPHPADAKHMAAVFAADDKALVRNRPTNEDLIMQSIDVSA